MFGRKPQNSPVVVKSARLSLREFRSDDWIAVQRYAGDPQVTEWLWWGPNSTEETQQFLHDARSASLAKPRRAFHLAAVRAADDVLLGGVSLNMTSDRDADAEVGYCFAPDSQGQGFASEAVATLVRYGFEALALHRIHAWISPANHPSIRLIERLGFRREGLAKANAKVGGEWVDSLLYAKLAGEGSGRGFE